MAPANDGKIDYSDTQLLPQLSTSPDIEKLKNLAQVDKGRKKMARRNHSRLLTILLVFLFAIGAFSATTNNVARRRPPIPVPAEELSRFQALLETIDPGHLHDILHTHLKEKYKHGVYQQDRQALEAVHQEDTVVATNLVELAKRQNNNGTTTTVPTQTVTTTPSPTATTQPSTVTTTTNAPPTTVTPTTNVNPPSSSSTTTVGPVVPSQSSSGQQPSNTPTSPTVPVSNTPTVRPTQGSSNTSPVPNQSTTQAPSNSQQPPTSTQSNKPNETPSNNPDKIDSSVTQQIIYKTTLPNGAATTVTSITVVPAADATGVSATRTKTGNAGLQTAAAARELCNLNAVLLGAFGFAAAIAL